MRRHEGGQKGRRVGCLFDELCHIFANNSALSLQSRLSVLESSHEEGHGEGEGARVDGLHKRGCGEAVDALLDLLGLGDGEDERGDERLEVLVGDGLAGDFHGFFRSRFDLLLGRPHELGDEGHDGGEEAGEELGGDVDELLEALEARFFNLPLGRRGANVEERGDDGGDSVLGNGLAEFDGRFDSSVAHACILVARELQEGWQVADERRFVLARLRPRVVADERLAARGKGGEEGSRLGNHFFKCVYWVWWVLVGWTKM